MCAETPVSVFFARTSTREEFAPQSFCRASALGFCVRLILIYKEDPHAIAKEG
jgi:hypothetical protein